MYNLYKMIIPIKCFTCGKVLADKYLYYQQKVKSDKLKNDKKIDDVIYLNASNIKKTIEKIF